MLDELLQFFRLVSLGLVLLLPLANPLTSMTLLLALGRDIPYKEKQRQITQATFYVIGIMLVTYYAGTWIMNTFGISIPGLRIAGGLIVCVIGFSMLFPKTTVGDIPEADQTAAATQHRQVPNIAFVPLALPGTAGPGTIAMIVSVAASAQTTIDTHPEWMVAITPLVIFSILGILFWVSLKSAGKVLKLIGPGGVEAVSRVMGFLLVCMGVQFVINGVLEVVQLHFHITGSH